MARISLENNAFYINPEQSWLRFNGRVLEEAEDERNPLLERIKFLAISASNLDEYFEVRMAGLLQRIEDGDVESGPDGLSTLQQRDLLAREIHAFVANQNRCWNEHLRPALAEEGVRVLTLPELSPEERAFVADYCARELDPLLTPVTVDPTHPFPRVINKALCLALLLRRRRRSAESTVGVITVPRVLPRIIRLPSHNGEHHFMFLADLVTLHAEEMYAGYDIVSSAAFRVTRNSNLYLQEEESRSLLETVRAELHNRRRGDAVRLEIEADADPAIIERLRNTFELDNWQVFRTDGPVNLSRLFTLYGQVDRPDLKYRVFTPREVQLSKKSRDLFEEIRRRDILLHHPYDSYNAVVSFIDAAANDPNVLSIKQTLYRTNEDSPIIDAMMDAAANRKEVTVVVELKARFDEASNIRWARHLENAGVQVFHGLVGLKTHCKLTLLVRRDPDGEIRRYAHLGTGNYNPVTAKLYTDLSLLTADEEITAAVHDVFNFLTANTERPHYEPLQVAPLDLSQNTLSMIAREAEHAIHKRPARIVAKMNGLLDKTVIQALYRASQAGVKIDLIVRGKCGLRPGIKGVSDRIKVRSIVGRFLEHSRIFYFANGGDEEIYLGSADWMPRNLYERVEVAFPVKDPLHRQRIKQEILETYLLDTSKARILQPDGLYVPADDLAPARARRKGIDAQEEFIRMTEGKSAVTEKPARRTRARTR